MEGRGSLLSIQEELLRPASLFLFLVPGGLPLVLFTGSVSSAITDTGFCNLNNDNKSELLVIRVIVSYLLWSSVTTIGTSLIFSSVRTNTSSSRGARLSGGGRDGEGRGREILPMRSLFSLLGKTLWLGLTIV